MKDPIAEIYGKMGTKQESHKVIVETKEGSGTIPGAVPVGQPVMKDTPKLVKGTGADTKVDGVKKGEENKERSTEKDVEVVGKKSKDKIPSTKNENANISDFDKLYLAVMNEDTDDLDEVIEDEGLEDTENSDIPEEEEEQEENELITRLKSIRDEIDAVIMDFEGVQETEEGEIEEPEMDENEPSEEEAPEFKESVEATGKPEVLHTKGEELQKGLLAPGKLGKHKKGVAAKQSTTKEPHGKPTELGKKANPTWNQVSDGPMGSKGAELIQ
jgi:hypothetical protein